MKVSLEWLRELTPAAVPLEELVRVLNFSGSKVETVTVASSEIRGVVVAQVLGIRKHPGADNLSLVDVGLVDGASQEVVCGAKNFAVGDRVPLAPVGARLPGLALTARKMRGVISNGMLCSGAELGISQDHSGILVLAPDAELGADVVAVLGLDDTVIDLEITPNRGDCMGMIGIAREVAAVLGDELTVPDAIVQEDESLHSPVTVEVRDEQGCPRYLARYATEIAGAPSPAWLQARLLRLGVRPISNVVDITNYVLLETGQPLHAFDASKIAEGRIVVRRASRDERIVTLDGVKRNLQERDLVIADPGGALAIAGVMGGLDSEVSGATTEVVIESAHFEPASVSLTSRRLGLLSEASARFERGSDPEMAGYAAARCAELLRVLAGGRVAARVADAYPQPYEPVAIELRPPRTGRILGVDIPAGEQAHHLRSLGLEVTERGETLHAVVPSWRRDLRREIDLVEEVARLAGLDLIPARLPHGGAGGLKPLQAADRTLRRTLCALGLTEAYTDSFRDDGDMDRLGLSGDPASHPAVRIANPMNHDEAELRTTLLPGLLRAASYNLARHAPGVALFEIARAYVLVAGGDLPNEPALLSCVAAGHRSAGDWRHPSEKWDFFRLKGALESALRALRLPPLGCAPVDGMPWHPTRAAALMLAGERIGTLGDLHPTVCDLFRVAPGASAFELRLDPLWSELAGRIGVEIPTQFPSAYVDVAVVVDEETPAQSVAAALRSAGEPELVAARLFDVYAGRQVPAGRKSLAYALELRASDRTLSREEALMVRDRIVRELEARYGAELRA